MKRWWAEIQVSVPELPPNRSLLPAAASAQVELQETVIYTVQSDTSSLHLPTIKQGLVVTNGPHAHGIAAPRDPALLAASRS